MAKTIKTGLIITGDAKGGVKALKLTDDQLGKLNTTQKKTAKNNKVVGISFADAAKKVTAYGAAAGIAAVAGIGAMVAKQLQAIDTNTKIADKLGIATEKLTAMHIQAELSGVGISTLNEGLQRMVRRVGEAAQGTGEAKNALKELNINAVELAKLSPDKQFAAIGDAMAGVGNQADRVRLAFKLFDSGGVALLNTLKGGSAAALEAAAFTEQWGLAINRVDSAKIEQANDAMAKVSQASDGLWKQLTVRVAPALTGIAGEILGVSGEMGSASSMADKLFDGMVTGISFAADAARGLQVVWKGITVLVAQGLSGILSAVAAVDRSVTALLNKMPEFLGGGTFTESSFLQNVAEAVKSTADGLTKELNTLATKALPSAAIKKWLKETEKEVQKTAEKIAAQSNASTALINDNINSLPDTLETSTAKMVATVQKNAPKAANVYVTAWDKAVERVDATFANAWTGAFDGFKSFSDNIVDSFKQMLAEMAHLAITKPILIGLGFGGSGSALAGGGGGGSLLSSLGGGSGGGFSITDLLSSGKSLLNINGAINGAINGTINALFDAGFQDAAASLGNYAQGITGASGGLGGAAGGIGLSLAAGFAGNFAGNSLGKGLFGKTANSSVGATAGGLIGSLFGPLGTFGGAALGGLLDSAFGGDGKKRVALGVRTNPDLPINGAGQARGGSGLLFTGYQKRTGQQGVDTTKLLVDQFAALDTSLTNLYGLLGTDIDLTGQSLKGRAHQAGKSGGDFFGSAVFNRVDKGQLAGAADAFLSEWTNAVTEQTGTTLDIAPIVALQGVGESLANTINRVQVEFVAVTGALDILGLELIDLSLGGLAVADGITQAFGGLENLSTGVAAYYAAFYTDAEKLDRASESLGAQFAALNIAMPDTREQFRGLVDGLDLTKQSAQNLFAGLLQIAPGFDQYLTALGATGATGAPADAGISTQVKDLSRDIFSRYTAERKAIKATAATRIKALRVEQTTMGRIAADLLKTTAGLKLSNLSPLSNTARLDFSRNQFNSTLAAARGGDLDAASGLGGIAQSYLSEASGFFASSGQYTDIFNAVTGSLDSLGVGFADDTDINVEIAKLQTERLKAELELGITAREQLDELVYITNSADTVQALLQALPQQLAASLANAIGLQVKPLQDEIAALRNERLAADQLAAEQRDNQQASIELSGRQAARSKVQVLA